MSGIQTFVGSFQVRSTNSVRLDVGKIRLCEGRKIQACRHMKASYEVLDTQETLFNQESSMILIYRRLEMQQLSHEYRSNKRGYILGSVLYDR